MTRFKAEEQREIVFNQDKYPTLHELVKKQKQWDAEHKDEE